MNKGYAFGFLIILLIVILGVYVAFTGFTASREAQQVQAGPEPATPEAQAPVAAPTIELAVETSSSPSPTVMALPTPVPGLTATLTAMAMPTGEPSGGETQPAEPTEPPPTEPPPAVAPTDTLAPQQTEPPTPVSVPAYQFRLAGPPAPDSNYPRCYIYGTVRDAAANGLEGVRVQASTTWIAPMVAVSKGGVDLGKYDILINCDALTWTVFLIDAEGNQISSQVEIPFNPDAANAYRVDWVRSY